MEVCDEQWVNLIYIATVHQRPTCPSKKRELKFIKNVVNLIKLLRRKKKNYARNFYYSVNNTKSTYEKKKTNKWEIFWHFNRNFYERNKFFTSIKKNLFILKEFSNKNQKSSFHYY